MTSEPTLPVAPVNQNHGFRSFVEMGFGVGLGGRSSGGRSCAPDDTVGRLISFGVYEQQIDCRRSARGDGNGCGIGDLVGAGRL